MRTTAELREGFLSFFEAKGICAARRRPCPARPTIRSTLFIVGRACSR